MAVGKINSKNLDTSLDFFQMIALFLLFVFLTTLRVSSGRHVATKKLVRIDKLDINTITKKIK